MDSIPNSTVHSVNAQGTKLGRPGRTSVEFADNSYRIFVECPPPFTQGLRGEHGELAGIPLHEGLDVVTQYLNTGLPITGFHHADLDRFEGAALRDEIPLQRHDTYDYATYLRDALDGFAGALIPHRVVVYETTEQQLNLLKMLAAKGIRHAVMVGKPFAKHPAGVKYQSDVIQILSALANSSEIDIHPGVIGIHIRANEPETITAKYLASGKRMFVMGQFLDAAEPMLDFLTALERCFEKRRLSFDGLEWNVGLAMYALKSRIFHAKLLRKDVLDCEERFRQLGTTEARINESINMNLEFADRVKTKADSIGLRIGFSIQPIIDRYADGRIHPATQGAITLTRELHALINTHAAEDRQPPEVYSFSS